MPLLRARPLQSLIPEPDICSHHCHTLTASLMREEMYISKNLNPAEWSSAGQNPIGRGDIYGRNVRNETWIQIEGIASTYCTMEVLNKKTQRKHLKPWRKMRETQKDFRKKEESNDNNKQTKWQQWTSKSKNLKKRSGIGDIVAHLPLCCDTDFIFADRSFSPRFLHSLVPIHAL